MIRIASTITPTGTDQLEIRGCVLGFLCGGETWTRVAPPIPSSPANSMAKGAPKTIGAAKTTPPNPAAKTASHGQSADAIGDICLLPDIARLSH